MYSNNYLSTSSPAIFNALKSATQSTQVQWHATASARTVSAFSAGKRSRLGEQAFALELEARIIYLDWAMP